MSDLADALTSLQRICQRDPRDWSADRHDAFIYGVCVGWQPVAQVADAHGWDASFVTRLGRLHTAVQHVIDSEGTG
jgi:hypothetical protein